MPMRSKTLVPATLALVAAGGCSVFGIRTFEQARFEVVSDEDGVEIRRYPELVVVQTTVPLEALSGDPERTAFRRLFAYLQGANTGSRQVAMTAPVLIEEDGREVAMTAPVLEESDGESMTMAFVLPSEFTAETAPRPTDSDVRLEVLPARRVAALTYSGSRSTKAFELRAEELLEWLDEEGLEAASEPRYAGYDPPFTLPFLRRHEVWVDLAEE